MENLIALRERVEDAGIRLNAIENVPISFYEDVMLGGPERDEQLEKLKRTIRNIGEAGIPIFGYHWAPAGVWRTGSTSVRGGAFVSAFDAGELDSTLTHDREYTEAELWENYEYSRRCSWSPRRPVSTSVFTPAIRRWSGSVASHSCF